MSHPKDNEPRSPELVEALRKRGSDEGQGIDDYWAWAFAAGFNERARLAIDQHAARGEPVARTTEAEPFDAEQELRDITSVIEFQMRKMTPENKDFILGNIRGAFKRALAATQPAASSTSQPSQSQKIEDLLKLLALAIHRLGGSMDVSLGDHLTTRDLTFLSNRDARGVGRIWLERLGDATAHATREAST